MILNNLFYLFLILFVIIDISISANQPSSQPSLTPSSQPSSQPTSQPSSSPSFQPSSSPSFQPSCQPSCQPTCQPTSRPSRQPSRQPSCQPTCQPTSRPSIPTSQPSSAPSNPTSQPTRQPSRQPSSQPSFQPTTPTSQPTSQPSSPTSLPSSQPSSQPSTEPSTQPSSEPTSLPTSLLYCNSSESVLTGLNDFYISTNGYNWISSCNNWFPYSNDTINNPCIQKWYGIVCDQKCTITKINLPSCNLQGTIPESITLVSTLKYIDLYNNSISGSLPSNIGYLNLSYIRMSHNLVTGSLPTSLSNISYYLNYLYIRANLLVGTIPNWLFEMKNLSAMDLSYNQLEGTLALSNSYNNLTYLNLEGNILTGSFPDLSNYMGLRSLFLGQNCFTADISNNLETICDLKELETLIIDGLSNNCRKKKFIQFTGPIPSCIFDGTLSELSQIALSGNYFNGSLPDISAYSSLVNVTISDNKLTGTFPVTFQRHSFMNLDISYNRLRGSLISDFNSSNSVSIIMLFNRLSGQPPESFYSSSAEINIVEGNLFGCLDVQLPFKDIHRDHFFCGSQAANHTLFSWFAYVSALLIVLSSCWYIQAAYSYRVIKSFKNANLDKLRNYLIALKDLFLEWWNISSYYLLIPKSKWEICTNVDSTLFQTRFTLDLLERVSTMAITLTFLNLFIYLPTYIIIKKTGDENNPNVIYLDQYFYTTTTAYFRGKISVAVTFIFVVISSICCSLVFVALIPVPKEVIALESDRTEVPTYITNTKSKKKKFPIVARGKDAIIQILNAAVALAMSSGYIYIIYFVRSVSSRLVEFIQYIMAAVLLFILCKVVPRLTTYYKIRRKSFKHKLLVFMSLIYVLVAPLIGTLLVSPWCLFNYFFPNKVNPTYYQLEWVPTNSPRDPQIYPEIIEITDHPFKAPWYYSFQCSSSIITSYFPVLSVMYLVLAVFNPILKIVCMILSNTGVVTSIKTDMWSRILVTLTSPIYLYAGTSTTQTITSTNSPISPGIELTTFASVIEGRLSGDKKTIQSKKLLNPSLMMTRVCIDITLLLTFGIASPILGLFITFSIVFNTMITRLAIGRFLSISKTKGDDIFEINCKRLEDLLRDEWRCLEDNWFMIAIFSGLFGYLFVFDYAAEYEVAVGLGLGIMKTLLVPAVLVYCKRLFTSMNYDIYADDEDLVNAPRLLAVTKLSQIEEANDNIKKSWLLITLTKIKKYIANIHFFVWKRFFRINALSKVVNSEGSTIAEISSPLAHRAFVQKVYLRNGTITMEQFKISLKQYYTENNPEKVSSLDTIVEAYASFEQALLDQLEEKYQKPVIIQKKSDIRAKIIEMEIAKPKVVRLSDE